MRDLLTYFGIALIVVLSVAFAAPYVLDFDSFRSRIAEELTLASGAQMRLNGPIAVRFLPTPRFSAENFDISGDSGRLHADKALFALSLPSLLQGRLEFSRASFLGADIVIDADRARAPAVGSLQFDNLVLRRARVTIARKEAPAVEISGLDLAVQVPTLQGPFNGRGSFDAHGRKVAYSFATDIIAKNLLPLKASLTWPDELAKLDLDGRVNLAQTPVFEGEIKAAGKAAPGSWTAQGALALNLDGAEAKDVSARLGEGALADKISGGGRYETRSGKWALELAAPSLAGEWADFFAAPLLAADGHAPLDLRAAVETLNWRGMTWSQAQLVWPESGPAQVKAFGPGGARIEISAAPDKAGWRGKAQLRTTDFAGFAAALSETAPAAGKALAGMNLHALEIGGDFSATPQDPQQEWALTNATLALDRGRFSGEFRFRPAKADKRPLLVASLAAPALDPGAAPDFASAWLDGLDLDLSLEAQTAKPSRGGELSGDGGRIKAHILRTGESMRLERLEMRNIGGADLTASASWGRDFAGLQGEARLKASDLSPLGQVLARLWPGQATKALASRAKSLSPADLTGKAAGGDFTLNGTLGATKFAALLLPATGGKSAAAVELTAPEAGPLLNQLGAQVVWTQKLGPTRISARGQPDLLRQGAQTVTISADIAGLHGEFRGAVADPARDQTIAGDLTVAGDAGRIIGGFSAAPSPRAPLRLAARAAWRDSAVTLQNLAGEWAGAKFAGDLSVDADGVKGALRCDRLSGPALAALVLGPPAPIKAGALWSSLSFAPVIFDPPSARMAIETADLQPLSAKAQFDLTLGPGVLSVAQAKIEGFDGVARGGFDLRREGGQVTLSGELEGENVALSEPAFSARLDGMLKFAGSGANAAAVVGSLAGEGAARLRDLVVEGAALGAPDQAFAASEANQEPFDAKQVAKSLDVAFAREALRRPEAKFAVHLAGGQLALTPLDDGGQGVEAGFDLRDAAVSLSYSAAAENLPAGWVGPPPRGVVAWSGPWRTPSRRIDATAFVNAVATRALEREQARIEKMKQEDQERRRALQAQPAEPAIQPAPVP